MQKKSKKITERPRANISIQNVGDGKVCESLFHFFGKMWFFSLS